MGLIFVRHAQSQGNATGNYSTASHDSLSELGRQQAECLAAALRGMTIDRVLVSPLLRAVQTIHPYLVSTGRVAEVWPELAEGCWQEREAAEASAFATEPCTLPPSLAPQFTFRDGRAVRPHAAETFAQGLYRARVVLQRLEPNSAEEGITLVVTHGHMLREMLNVLTGSGRPVDFAHDNCAMTRVSTGAAGRVIHYINRPTWNGGGHLQAGLDARRAGR